ncbi:hypothetical protein [Thiothrix subterranea]|uniref:Uncharacterized protein n=1 Tax=Thiothrix subterranea TaxID=2735563 RepID=A0AA51R2G4_9GAMM|nr:hypothetical protein [Thiothrix subterranea]MDQ5768276.1 hypothetical protein [Thiothrix subterranea]WML87804.1 hypothetical protein RCG00_05410 [Thiothrix subterranea]
MLKHSKTGPLKVALLAISPHNRAILEFFFSGAGRNLFRVVPEAEAEAFILDHDHPDAKEDWQQRAALRKPGIILSVHPAELPNCIWIPKPLTSRALTDAADRVQELAANLTPESDKAQRPSVNSTTQVAAEKPAVKQAEVHFRDLPQPFGIPTHTERSDRKSRSLIINLPDEEEPEEEAAPAMPEADIPITVFDPAEADIPLEEVDRPVDDSLSQEEAENRWKALCGEQDDVQSAADVALFTPENYVLSTILEAIRVARDTQQTVYLKLSPQDYALLMPQQGLAYCTLDTRSEEFRVLCNNPVQTGQIALHIPNSAELEGLEQHAMQNADALLDLEAFVWVSSLLTARGRLGRGVEIEQTISLKYWPNLTRLEQFPHIMRIAALWNQRPASSLDIANALAIPQRYVFAFHTAANALNLFEMDQNKLKSREKEQPKQENRGFFSRLLKRLLGGGTK